MNEKHLTDLDIENFVYDDKMDANSLHHEHLISCVICKEKLEVAQTLKHQLSMQVKPGFGFDLVSLVMPQIEALKPEKNWISIIVNGLITLSIIATICLMVYFRNYFLGLTYSLTMNGIGLLLIPVIFYMAWMCKDLIQSYRNALSQLKTS